MGLFITINHSDQVHLERWFSPKVPKQSHKLPQLICVTEPSEICIQNSSAHAVDATSGNMKKVKSIISMSHPCPSLLQLCLYTSSVSAERVGQGEMGGITCRVTCTCWLLGLALKDHGWDRVGHSLP